MDLYAKIPKFALSHNDKESFKKILDPEGDPDQHQNLMGSSLGWDAPLVKIWGQSVYNFFRKVANRQTNLQTNKPTLPKT